MRHFLPTLLLATLGFLFLQENATGIQTIPLPHKWTAGEKTQKADSSKNGVVFPCPFNQNKADRYFWDGTTRIHLAQSELVELDLTCMDPAAVRTLTIYFKSGKGWYEWSGSLSRGRQLLSIDLDSCQPLGTPRSRTKIDGIRISPWRGNGQRTSIVLHGISTVKNGIVILEGIEAATAEGEQHTARRAARRIHTWLNELHIPTRIIRDDKLTLQMLAHTSLIVLPYNPQLSKGQLKILHNFVNRGGKLFVFYSADPELANLMNLKLGTYKAADNTKKWAAIRFRDPGEWNVPPEIRQSSWNIRPVYPDGPTCRIIADWSTSEGTKLDDPAIVQSPAGFWMTHILLNEDIRPKQDMLLGLMGSIQPSVWARGAWKRLQSSGKIASYCSFQEACADIENRKRHADNPDQVQENLEMAKRLHQMMAGYFQEGHYPQVVTLDRELRKSLVHAYASVQTPAQKTHCAIWAPCRSGQSPEEWDQLCSELKKSGITDLFLYVGSAAQTHYASQFVPASNQQIKFGDQLKACMKAAEKYDIAVHAWIICWKLDGATPDVIKRWAHHNRLQKDRHGEDLSWLNPVLPENQAFLLRMINEILTRYPDVGIHLDYIRYPESHGSFDTASRKAFESWLGFSIRQWPDDVLSGGRAQNEWKTWRSTNIDSFVAKVSELIQQKKHPVALSAAVFPEYPQCISGVGQNWAKWVQSGWINFACPMSYTEQAGQFEAWTKNQIESVGSRKSIWAGIGVNTSASQLEPDQTIDQILRTHKLKTAGFTLFRLDEGLRKEQLPLMKQGVTRTRE